MTLTERKNACSTLGKFVSQFKAFPPQKKENIPNNDLFFDGMLHQIKLAEEHNGWFTKENITYAFQSWADALTPENLNKWLDVYTIPEHSEKTVAIVMAGNIPLVGFHDFLAAFLSGHRILVKQSSKDKHLLPYLVKYLELLLPKLKGRIKFTSDKLENFDAVIATGSDNTARYFSYYFKEKPHIIRKNRNSVAVLTGRESEAQLQALGEDIFRYYGLGCRNVSKLFVPKDYDFNALFAAVYPWHTLIDKQKYANNYDYNKAVYLMSLFPILENGFLMLKEDSSYASPIATVFYEYYDTKDAVQQKLESDSERIQCVVANGFSEEEIPFGKTQQPQLWDYADNVDTMDFLVKI